MTVQDVYDWLDAFAPFATQEGFDNAGLLLGRPDAQIHRVLFALDATLPVVTQAIAWGVDLILTHHPLMFGGIQSIRYDQPEGAILAAIASANISLIAAHTNLDQAPGGTGDSLANTLGLQNCASTLGNPYLRTGSLSIPQTARAFLAALDGQLNAHARLYGDPDAILSRVTVGAGAIGEEYPLVAADGAQAFVVGEIKHHELLAAQAQGTLVFEVGHYPSEQPGLIALYQRFQSEALRAGWPVTALLTTIQPLPCIIA